MGCFQVLWSVAFGAKIRDAGDSLQLDPRFDPVFQLLSVWTSV